MASIDLGRVKFVWKGDYDVAVTYKQDDVVYHNGSTWVYVNATDAAGNAPADGSAYWNKMAQGSDLGSISGLANGDIIYYDGSDFQRLAMGTAAQVLRVNAGASALEYATPTPNVLQTKMHIDRASRSTANNNYYYFGATTENDINITPLYQNSIIRVSTTIFGESNSHNTHFQLQYKIGTGGTWTSAYMPTFGVGGHIKVGAYPDSDYNSTPHTNNGTHADVYNTTDQICFRYLVHNGGTFYHNRSVATQYESGTSMITIQELYAGSTSLTKR